MVDMADAYRLGSVGKGGEPHAAHVQNDEGEHDEKNGDVLGPPYRTVVRSDRAPDEKNHVGGEQDVRNPITESFDSLVE